MPMSPMWAAAWIVVSITEMGRESRAGRWQGAHLGKCQVCGGRETSKVSWRPVDLQISALDFGTNLRVTGTVT